MGKDKARPRQKLASQHSESTESMHSWFRKNEQMIISIDARLSALETRFSVYASDAGTWDGGKGGSSEHRKDCATLSPGLQQWTRLLDQECGGIRALVQTQGQDVSALHSRLDALEGQLKASAEATGDSDREARLQARIEKLEQREPLTMRLGRLEVPIEVTGIIGGAVAFTVAALVVLDRKELLVHPVFLSGIGALFIASAVAKRIRHQKTACTNASQLPDPVPTPVKSGADRRP